MDAPYEPFKDDKDFFPQYSQPFKNSKSRESFDNQTSSLVARVLGNDRKEILEDFFYRESRHDIELLKDYFDSDSLGEFIARLRPGSPMVVNGDKDKFLESRNRMFLVVWFYSLDENHRRSIGEWASGKSKDRTKPYALRQLEHLHPEFPPIEGYYGTLRWRLNSEAVRSFIHERHYPEEFDHFPEE